MSDCAGCGRDLGRPFESVVVLLGSHEFMVCRKQNCSGSRPRESCRAAAWEKVRPCSGCGQAVEPWKWRSSKICDGCRDDLARGRSAKPPCPMRWVGVDSRTLYDCGDSVVPLVASMLVRCLGEIVGRVHVGDQPASDAVIVPERSYLFGSRRASLWVEVREDALEAARWAFEGIYQLASLQYRLGVDRGHNVLQRLATGEVKIDDYDRDEARRHELLPEDP